MGINQAHTLEPNMLLVISGDLRFARYNPNMSLKIHLYKTRPDGVASWANSKLGGLLKTPDNALTRPLTYWPKYRRHEADGMVNICPHSVHHFL